MAYLSKDSPIEIARQSNKIWGKQFAERQYEDIAQTATASMYDLYKDSIVLARVFLTVPFKDIPAGHKKWVRDLCESVNLSHQLHEHTPVLCLVSTAGENYEWNNRRNSQGHVGIPLLSAEFIEAIPMMARLMREVTGDLSWLDEKDWATKARSMGKFSGVFHVRDAAKDKDNKDRHIIAAQDFVGQHGVKTVFGIGGGYIDGSLAIKLYFTREILDVSLARAFLPSLNLFKIQTFDAVAAGQIFSE